MTCENSMKFKFQCPYISAMFDGLCVVYACFCVVMAELDSCDRDYKTTKPKLLEVGRESVLEVESVV